MKQLQETINGVDLNLVIIGTPVELRRFLDIREPSLRVKYEIEEIGELTIKKDLEEFKHGVITPKIS